MRKCKTIEGPHAADAMLVQEARRVLGESPDLLLVMTSLPADLTPSAKAQMVRDARASTGLTAEAFATVIKVSAGRTVRRWEAGDRPVPGPLLLVAWMILMVPGFALRIVRNANEVQHVEFT